MKHRLRHKIVWKILHAVLPLWLKPKFNYSYESCDIPGPCLVLANHDTDWDPLLLGLAFPRQMYFVASEHIFRWGFLSKLITWLVDPISRLKGATAGDTALTIIRRLRGGANVAMFANGSRSFTGLSEDILPSTGKLARASGATLITYRLDGGYFTQPRWAGKNLRRGRITGRVVNVYPPETLKSMKAEAISAAIDRDLFVDAYAVQRERMIPFTGKNLAEGLETVLCVCPRCGALGALRSQGDRFFCSCGYEVRYNEYGFFEGPGAVYDSVTDWDKAQTARLFELAGSTPEGQAIFRDGGMALYELLPGHRSVLLGRGGMSLYRDRLDVCGRSFPLEELGGFALHGPFTVNLSHAGHSYEIVPGGPACTRKYAAVIAHLQHQPSAG